MVGKISAENVSDLKVKYKNLKKQSQFSTHKTWAKFFIFYGFVGIKYSGKYWLNICTSYSLKNILLPSYEGALTISAFEELLEQREGEKQKEEGI